MIPIFIIPLELHATSYQIIAQLAMPDIVLIPGQWDDFGPVSQNAFARTTWTASTADTGIINTNGVLNVVLNMYIFPQYRHFMLLRPYV